MNLNLIIDGNYILSKITFTLHKNNLLFGALMKSLETSISNYRKLYPFSKIYVVSDSKEKSWRKTLYSDYKLHRKRDNDIDWAFVYSTYEEFKKNLKGVTVLESPSIEGDDWISYVVEKSNRRGESTLIISNDYDIKQMINYSLSPLYINIMSNEMFNQEKIFLPKNYQVFLNEVNKLPQEDIFNLNNNSNFISLMNKFLDRYHLNEINGTEVLMVKAISGDTSDNIQSVYQVTKNGKTRGIGSKGAKTIYDNYLLEFGEMSLEDPDLYENIADLICEKKKISKTNIPDIVNRIVENMKLIDLRIDNFPDYVIEKMKKLTIE